MEVDPDMLIPVVPTTCFFQHHELPLEGMRNISVADEDACRECINDFLMSHTVYDILPDSGKVFVVDVSMPIKQAFHLLHDQGLAVAPLWDSERQQFVGMLGASDFIAILRQIGSHRASLSEEQLESHTIAAWKDEKTVILGLGTLQRPLLHVGPDDSLKDLVQKLLQNHVATVPVLSFSSQEARSPQLLHLATLSGILQYLCRHLCQTAGLLPLLSQPLGSLPLGTWIWTRRGTDRSLAILRADAPLSAALALLIQEKVSAIPIVDVNGSLQDIYARSDITALARDKAYARVQLDQVTIEQALQLVHHQSASAGAAPVPRYKMCLHTDKLQVILERLAVPGVRRIICVEAGSRRVEGIVTLQDVFNFLL